MKNKYFYVLSFLLLSLLGYISYLIITQHQDHQKIEATLRDKFQKDFNSELKLVQYFFNDRFNDMAHLSGSSEISAYFINESLGMSMQYGLKQSLTSINSLFSKFKDRNYIEKNPIYSQILLVNSSASLLMTDSINSAAANASPPFRPVDW